MPTNAYGCEFLRLVMDEDVSEYGLLSALPSFCLIISLKKEIKPMIFSHESKYHLVIIIGYVKVCMMKYILSKLMYFC